MAPSFRIRGIGPAVTERLNNAGIYTMPDAQKYVDTYGVCGLLQVIKVGPRRAGQVLGWLEGRRCPRCGKDVRSKEMEAAYEAVLSRRECPFIRTTTIPPKQEQFKEPENPPLPWVGGKRKMVDDILPLIPEHSVYVEPCAGGAAIFFAKQPAEENVLNGKDKGIIDAFKELKKGDFDVGMRPSKSKFYELKKKAEAGTATTEEWLYLLKIGFGHKSPNSGQLSFPGKYMVKHFGDRTVKTKERLKMPSLKLEAKDYRDVVDEYHGRKDAFFFVDPPYHDTSNPYAEADLTPWNVRHTMEGVEGKAMVTYNDCPDVRDAFSGWNFKKVETTHTLQGGQRAGKELIITNYPLGEGGKLR